ncbi:unnamed protein product [Symbiodinium sp. CCMP2592]|nr:unnamed protein product [Symbiodinium sp. CCMP2592]
MGKRGQWSDEEWRAWRSSGGSTAHNGWSRQGGKNKGKQSPKGSDEPRRPMADSRRDLFPSFETMTAEVPGPSSRVAQRTKTDMDIDEEAPTNGMVVKGVQKLLNGLRKAEGKARRLDEESEELQQKWVNYKQKLQDTYVKERAKYQEKLQKIRTDLEEAEKAQEDALLELQTAFAEPQSLNRPKPAPMPPADPEALAELDELLKSPEKRPRHGLADVIAGAIQSGGGDRAKLWNQLLGAIGEHRKGPSTPPRRSKPVEPSTPLDATKTAKKEAAMDAAPPSYSVAAETSNKENPYVSSPSRPSELPKPEATIRTRSRTSTRIPIKQIGRQPAKPVVAGTGLAEKLEARREAELAGELDISSDEDDMVGGLGAAPRHEAGLPEEYSRPARQEKGPGMEDGRLGIDQAQLSLDYEYSGPVKTISLLAALRSLKYQLLLYLAAGFLSYQVRRMTESTPIWDTSWRYYDVFDVGGIFLQALLLWCGTQMQRLSTVAAGWCAGLYMIQFVSLLSVLTLGMRGRRPLHRRVRTLALGGQPRLVLAFCVLTTARAVRTTQAAPSCGSGTIDTATIWIGPPPPRQTDIELWMSGQLTAREQLAKAEQNMVLTRPLQHSEGEAPPPTYHIPAETVHHVEHTIAEDEIRAVHISAWLASPFYEVEAIDLGMSFPLSIRRLCDAIKDTSTHMPEWAETVIPTTPQIAQLHGSFVAIPSWIPAVGKHVLVMDNRMIGGEIFPFYHEGPVTKASMLAQVPEDDEPHVDIYVFGERTILETGTRQPIQGGVVQAVYKDQPCHWEGPLEARLTDPTLWNPRLGLPGDNQDPYVVYQGPESQLVYYDIPGADMHREALAEQLMGFRQGHCWIAQPRPPIASLTHAGRCLQTQIAVNPGPASTQQDDPEATVLFLDLRGLGFFPQWVDGWTVIVEGGELTGDPEIRKVAHCEVLNFFLKEEAELTPSPHRSSTSPADGDSTDEDHDMDGDESSTPRDALPDSSDLTTPSPDLANRSGPPPPQPVNRSRSPRRRAAESTGQPLRTAGAGERSGQPDGADAEGTDIPRLNLADLVNPPSYDLMAHQVPLPDVTAQIGEILMPWPPLWAVYDLKEETARAVNELSPWTALLPQLPEAKDAALHLYTDVSAGSSQKKLGFGVAILLQVGACCALIGLLGGSLHDPQGPHWPTEGPGALRAEQVALAVAVLWSLQFNVVLPGLRYHCHFDCYAAGWAATGDWSPTDPFAERVHLLELVARHYIPEGIHLTHVPAHTGEAWNELADVIAKQGANNCCHAAPPSAAACQAFLEADLSWTAATLHAHRHRSLPISAGALVWSPTWEETNTAPLRPEQVLPVISEEWGHAADPARFSIKVLSLNAQGMQQKHPFYEQQLDELQCNICMLQEVKQPASCCRSKRYIRLTTEGLRHWGVSIWVSRTRGVMTLDGKPLVAGTTDVQVKVETERLLVIEIAVADGSIALVSAHCPHSARKEEAEGFLQELERQLSQLRHAQLIIVGADLNCRLPPDRTTVTGGLRYGEPDDLGERITRVCETVGLWAPSTFRELHQGDSYTYRHPGGGAHRLDYILLGGRTEPTRLRSEVGYQFDTLNPNEDHHPVLVQLDGEWKRGGRRRLRRARYDREKMATSEGRKLIAESMRLYAPPEWNVHPDLHYQHLLDHIHAMLEQHFAKPGDAPRASFVPSWIWEKRAAKLRFKAGSLSGLHTNIMYHHVLYGIYSAAVKVVTYRAKRAIREGKSAFLRDVAHGYSPPTGANHFLSNVKKAGLGKSSRTTTQRQLPALLDAQGRPAATREDHDAIWLQHFGDQEWGTIVELPALLRRPHPPIVADEGLHWTLDCLPSVLELEEVYRAAPRHKAAGPDSVPGELIRAAPAAMAVATHALMAEAAMRLHQPFHWRGGYLFECYKRQGDTHSAESYRSLFVSNIFGKCMHKVYKKKIGPIVASAVHPMHLGSKRGAPVTFAAMQIMAHMRLHMARRRSTATLFLDSKQAYYRVCREICMGKITDDIAIAKLFAHFGLPVEDYHTLHAEIETGGVLADCGVPPAVRHVIKDLHNVAWFSTQHGDGRRVCVTRAGSRPGESFADVVFGFIYERILQQVSEVANAEGLLESHPYDEEIGPFGSGANGYDVLVQDSTWADDSAWPVSDGDPLLLLRKASRLSSLVISHLQGMGMQPNMKRGKTSLLIHLVGRGVRAARARFFPNGESRLYLADLDVHVEVVPSYVHLGGAIEHHGCPALEARRRLAIAGAAYEDGRRILLGNRTIDLPARARTFEAAVRPTFFNIALWLPTGPAWAKIETGYTSLLRRMLAPSFKDKELFRIPDPLIHLLVDSPPLYQYARKSRLSFLLSLANHGPPCLWAVLQAEGQWCAQICADLQWLVDTDRSEWPAVHGAAWPEWWRQLRQSPGRFKRRLTKKAHEDFAQEKRTYGWQLGLWSMYCQAMRTLRKEAPGDAKWACRRCRRLFPTRAGLSVHLFKSHGRTAAYRACVEGTCCKGCGREYWSTNKLAVHLRDHPRCVRSMLQHGHRASSILPGLRSRGWRAREQDQYTPAVSQQSGPRLEDRYGGAQGDECERAQRELEELLLDAPARRRSILEQAFPECVLDAYPLYPEEIQHVIGEAVHDLPLAWRAETELFDMTEELKHVMTELLEGYLTIPGDAKGCVKDDGNKLVPSGFRAKVDAIDWGEVLRDLRVLHVTPSQPVYICLTVWEAAQTIGAEYKLYGAAVDELTAIFVPSQIQEAWQRTLAGEAVQVIAPPAFWATAFARPFLMIGLCPCI